MERGLEGVVCGSSRKAAVNLINRNKNSQGNLRYSSLINYKKICKKIV